MAGRQTVCIQGLGYVGAALAVAIASALNEKGEPRYRVIGVDIDTQAGNAKVAKINQGVFPFAISDTKLAEAMQKVFLQKNLMATTDEGIFAEADYVIVAIPLDINCLQSANKKFVLAPFKSAIQTFAKHILPHCLVIVETTVPPGTSRQIILPILKEAFQKRGLPSDSILLAHSYERVMPGSDYLDSIINFHHCYAGYNAVSANACENFLSTVVNVKDWPLTRLQKLESSEIAKVLENSYRAVNIAFIEEWAALAEDLEINLYEIINAIRMRPTHSNIRQPGFGVGGYCLTKDPLFSALSCQEILNKQNLQFPFCELAVTVNQFMPLRCFKQMQKELGELSDKKILLLGISYKQEVGDTRYSPASLFYDEALKHGCKVSCHDPYLTLWPEKNLTINQDIHHLEAKHFDAVVLAVPHQYYLDFDFCTWAKYAKLLFFDACAILTEDVLMALKQQGHPIFAIGRGKI